MFVPLFNTLSRMLSRKFKYCVIEYCGVIVISKKTYLFSGG